MGIPQILIIVLHATALGCELAKHGKIEISKHNFWTMLLSTTITFGILAWGGFFN